MEAELGIDFPVSRSRWDEALVSAAGKGIRGPIEFVSADRQP